MRKEPCLPTHSTGSSIDMPVRATGCQHHEVSEHAYVADINDAYILCLGFQKPVCNLTTAKGQCAECMLQMMDVEIARC